MALSETARLLASLDLKDGLTPVIGTMTKSLDKFDDRIGKTSRLGHAAGTAIKAGVAIGAGALAGLVGLSLELAKEGQASQDVQIKYAAAIANSGKVSQAYVGILNAQQAALMDLSGADDEAIKAAQTQLILMGLTGEQVAKLTPLVLDLSKATGKDLTTATLAVGKAAQGSNTALQRMGIIVPKNADAIDILNKRFGGTTKALSGQLDTRLAVLQQRLSNVREEAGIKLLPAMTKIVDVVGKKLVPAFGTFIDAILPSVLDGLDKLGGFLEGGGATSAITKFLDIAKSAAPVIKQAASDTLTIVQTAVGLFSSLPPEIQALAVAGLTIDKLTGGLVTNLAGGLISAVLAGFKGVMSVNAGVVNVNAAASTGGAPLPGSKQLDVVDFAAKFGFALTSAGILAGAVNAAGNPAVQAQIQSGGGAVGQRASQFQKGTTDAVQDGFRKLLSATDRAKAAAAANARSLAAAIKAQDLTPNVIIRNTVPVTTQTIINGRLVAANFSRYTSVIGGKVVNATSQSGV